MISEGKEKRIFTPNHDLSHVSHKIIIESMNKSISKTPISKYITSEWEKIYELYGITAILDEPCVPDSTQVTSCTSL